MRVFDIFSSSPQGGYLQFRNGLPVTDIILDFPDIYLSIFSLDFELELKLFTERVNRSYHPFDQISPGVICCLNILLNSFTFKAFHVIESHFSKN